MPEGSDGATAATGTGGNSFLPWHLIPTFKPGETDVNEYTRRIEFLANIWPQEHLPLLAPRACMLCEGTAFAKVVRLDPEKLRVSSTDGVKLVVKTLGGVWGQSRLEKKYERFERAIFSTIQKNDETNTSYIARHEVQYEDLMSMGAILEEMRAYILLRNSGLPAEDKKRIIVEANGELEYSKVISALQLLGSKFFGEVQTGSKSQTRNKTYDANMVDEAEMETEDAEENVFTATEASEETIYEILMAEGDEDALVMSQFEEAIIVSLQSDPEVASCLNAYADARKRLLDKAKGRGFWGPSKSFKGKGKGKNKGGFKSQFRKPLAQRILDSTCRICHQKGHWKAECPQRNKASGSNMPSAGATAFAGVSMTYEDTEMDHAEGDVISELPGTAVAFMVEEVRQVEVPIFHVHGYGLPPPKTRNSWSQDKIQSQIMKIRPDLVQRLRAICRSSQPEKPMPPAPDGTLPDPLRQNLDERPAITADAFFVSQGSSGIVDLGASMSVIGTQQFHELCQSLPMNIKARMKEAPCQVNFRFGNDSTVTGRKAVFFPIGSQWIKVVVVPSNTPFLIANSVFRALGAVIDTESNLIHFKKLDRSIPITLTDRKLYRMDFQDLLTCPFIDTKTQSGMQSAMMSQEVTGSNDMTPVSHDKLGLPKRVRFMDGDSTSEPPSKPIEPECPKETTEPPVQQHRLETPSIPDQPDHSRVALDHGSIQSVRSPCRSPAQVVLGQHRKPRSTGRCHEDVTDRAQPVPHGLWQGSSWQTLPRYGERTQVPRLVRRDLQAQQEDQPYPVPSIHPAPFGSSRIPSEPGHAQECSQGQRGPEEPEPSSSARSSTRSVASELGGRGDHGNAMGARAEPVSARRGDEHDARTNGRDGECAAADPSTPDAQPLGSVESHQPMSKHQVADLCAAWQEHVEPNDIFDPMFTRDVGETICVTRENNWVAKEMWNFFSMKGVLKDPRRLALNLTDVMEVYCSESSELTSQAQAQGLMAERFCRKDGDLSTIPGRQALYNRLLKCLPRNLWLSPKCTAWCKWNVFNMSKSPEMAQKVFEARAADQVHLLLCDALFQFQMWRSPQSHAHLEQPKGSQMIYQEELQAILDRALIAHCDMCRAGRLKHPVSGKLIQKGTQVITTSRIMHRQLNMLRCDHTHEHDTVAGSFRHPHLGRINVSQYTELYTRAFASRISRCLQCISQVRETSVPETEPAFVQQSSESSGTPIAKRQKILGKQMPPPFYQHEQECQEQGDFLTVMSTHAPRVGKRCFLSGELLEKASTMFPQMVIKAIEVCKGADRCRSPCEGINKKNATHRFTMGIHRHQAGHFCDEAWEDWTVLTRKALNRKCQPARLLVMLFGSPRAMIGNSKTEEASAPTTTPKMVIDDNPDEPVAKRFCKMSDHAQRMSLEPSVESTTDQSGDASSSNAPMESSRKSFHGPHFLKLSAEQRQQLYRMHQNLGHPDSQVLGNVLRDQGWDSQAIEGIKDMHCPSCFENQKPKIARPGHLGEPRAFNDLVTIDAVTWTSAQGMNFTFYHMTDAGTNFQVAFICDNGTSKEVASQMQTHWFSWAGPPKQIMCDSAGEFCSDEFASFLQGHDIKGIIIPADAHWQMGKCERHGAILQDMLNKFQLEQPITCRDDMERALCHCTAAKNSLSRCKGYSPELLVLGKSRHMPASVTNDDICPADFMPEEVGGNHEMSQFHQNLLMRERARIAFIRTDHDLKLRRSLLRRSRPERCSAKNGEWVMFWREGKGALHGAWHGPAEVLMRENPNVVWLSHLSRLYRCAPEHIRNLSSRESEQIAIDMQDKAFPKPMPEGRLGTGVFQYHDISQSSSPPQETPHNNSNGPDNSHNVNNPNNPNTVITPDNPDLTPADHAPAMPTATGSVPSSGGSEGIQPDSEPEATVPETPSGEVEQPPEMQPWEIPVPESDGDSETCHATVTDEWVIDGQYLIRKHNVPRYRLFCPTNLENCPIPIEWLTPQRQTKIVDAHHGEWLMNDQWHNNIQAHYNMPHKWQGTTTFNIHPQYTQQSIEQQMTNMCADVSQKGQTIEVALSVEEIHQCMKQQIPEQIAFLASAAKKQRAEVKEKNLTAHDLKLFQGAKAKEIQSWLTTETVRRIARSQIPEDQILRSRWVLTWKPVEPTTQDPNPQAKPKARLVILGYEDPQLESLARDSPTLGKDSRTLILQYAASAKWQIRSFDIQTAFLRGSRQDGRILGMEPPTEMRELMNLQPWECCELLKSAYGLVNAPLLWYEELKSAMLKLNFQISPLDPCTFVLPRQDGAGIHGLVGIHVDDGLGAGDKVFEQAIAQLENCYPFGSKKETDFIFTGIHISQQWDGSIELDQTQYIEDIPAINIERSRRQEPESPVTSDEKQALRGLIGSIQYAATNTRPDLSAKLSLLQARINCATIKDLSDANKLLQEAKQHKDTKITIKSIPLQDLRFVSFSDASFANRANAQSQKGCLIMAASKQIGEWKASDVSPLLWYSRKIARVVSSTLASETYALSGSVDLLSWMRIHWSWLLRPSDGWKDPERYLAAAPEAYAVVDCKSLYDLIQKTNIPQCQEHRVTLEALIIKERLREGIVVKWVHSAAQLADSLTKYMDCTNLRAFLKHGRCIIHDVDEILRARADKRSQKRWQEQHQNSE